MKCVWMIQQTAGILKDDTEPNEVTESGNEFHAVVSNSSCSKTVLKLSWGTARYLESLFGSRSSIVFSFPGSRFPGARDSRTFSFPISREWKRLDSREIGTSNSRYWCSNVGLHMADLSWRLLQQRASASRVHVHGEDEEFNDMTPRPPPLSTCSWSTARWPWLEPVGALVLAVNADGMKR